MTKQQKQARIQWLKATIKNLCNQNHITIGVAHYINDLNNEATRLEEELSNEN